MRMRGLAKYLPRYGWEATVLTPYNDGNIDSPARVVQTRYDDVMVKWKERFGLRHDETFINQVGPGARRGWIFARLLVFMWDEIFAYPDTSRGWYKHAIEAGDRLLCKEKYDAIVSSALPPISHLIGRELKVRHGIPWIADFQDPWTSNPYIQHTPVRRLMEKHLEIKTLLHADAITAVTSFFAQQLEEIHKGIPTYCVPLGFDPDETEDGNKPTSRFTITHTGGLYMGKRDPRILFEALNGLASDSSIDLNDIQVDFYGYNESWLDDKIRDFSLQGIARTHGPVPRKEALRRQVESQILLLLTWNDPRDKGFVPGKLIDYLAAKRPILSIGRSESTVSEILNRTKAGDHVCSVEGTIEVLRRAYKEFKKTGRAIYRGETRQVESHSLVHTSKAFAAVLDTVTGAISDDAGDALHSGQ